MNKLKKFVTVIFAATLAGMCFAPIEDMPDGAKFHPELSQAELERHQGGGMAGQVNQSSSAPMIDNGASLPNSNSDAASMVSQGGASGDSAALSLQQAGADQGTPAPKNEGANLMFAGLFIIIGLAVAMGVRAYMDKSIPDVPGKKR